MTFLTVLSLCLCTIPSPLYYEMHNYEITISIKTLKQFNTVVTQARTNEGNLTKSECDPDFCKLIRTPNHKTRESMYLTG